MAEAGEECLCLNGYGGRVLMLHRDSRYLTAGGPGPDGAPADLDRRADLCVFEVFDCGLLGEGALHSLAAARRDLLAPGAEMVPAGAEVFCMPVEMRGGRLRAGGADLDVSGLDAFARRADYEEVDLAGDPAAWRALGPPVAVAAFDFREAEAHLEPWGAELALPVDAGGTCNAVAFWFDLHLDSETTLRTSPLAGRGGTWRQAVQRLPGRRVEAGGTLPVAASHDTYGFSFAYAGACGGGAPEGPGRGGGGGGGGGEEADADWAARRAAVEGAGRDLARAVAQNPLEYRKAAGAAIAIARCPESFGVDAADASAFCARLMS